MCVIAIKHNKVNITYKTILKMFEANPHGAGFAIVFPTQTLISKGYENPKDLWYDVNELQDHKLVLHFRFATHGQINAEMCHPFIIDTDLNISTQDYVETEKPVLMHNGILANYGNKIISDTADFVTNCLALHGNDIKSMLKLLHLTGSLFTLIYQGKIYKVGEFEKYENLKVSNTNFNFTWNKYDEYEYDYELSPRKIGYSRDDWKDGYSLFPESAYSDKKGK